MNEYNARSFLSAISGGSEGCSGPVFVFAWAEGEDVQSNGFDLNDPLLFSVCAPRLHGCERALSSIMASEVQIVDCTGLGWEAVYYCTYNQ